MHREVCPTSPLQSFSHTNATVGRTAPNLSLARTLLDGVRLRMISFNMGQLVVDYALKLLDAVKVPNPNTRKDLKKDSKVFIYKLNDLTVCDQVFRLAHGLSQNAMKRGRQASLKDLGSVPKIKKTWKAINDHDTNDTKGTEQQEQTLELEKDIPRCRIEAGFATKLPRVSE